MAEFRSKDNFGMDKELAAKEAAKRDPAVEAKVQAYVEQLSGRKFTGGFLESLKDGQLLCLAMNAVKPGAIKKINESSMPFKQMENISNFLRACRNELGMSEHDLFTTPDLYDEKSPVNVTSGMIAFSRAANKAGFNGPSLAPKESKVRKSLKRWSLNARNAAVSMLNMGSYGIMEKPSIDTSNDINFGAQKAGKSADESAVNMFNMGSHGIQDKVHIDTSNSATFGAEKAGVSKSTEVSKLGMGSKGIMDQSTFAASRSGDVTFGADAGRS